MNLDRLYSCLNTLELLAECGELTRPIVPTEVQDVIRELHDPASCEQDMRSVVQKKRLVKFAV